MARSKKALNSFLMSRGSSDPVPASVFAMKAGRALQHHAVQRGLRRPMALLVERGRFGARPACRPPARTRDRGGDLGRSQAARYGSIARSAARRCVPTDAGPPSGGCACVRAAALRRRVGVKAVDVADGSGRITPSQSWLVRKPFPLRFARYCGRRGRKNSAISRARASGCSIAAK